MQVEIIAKGGEGKGSRGNGGGRKKRRPPGKVRQPDRGSRTEMHGYTRRAKKRTRVGSAVGTIIGKTRCDGVQNQMRLLEG